MLSGLWLVFQSLFWWMSLWKPPYNLRVEGGELSFNPCFGGCRSERVVLLARGRSLLVFQSLFWWMSLWKASCLRGRWTQHHVSILVLVDVALKGQNSGDADPDWSRFQSLFWWMSLWKTVAEWLPIAGSSFNPCFGGCRSESWISKPTSLTVFLFQSLFWWMSLWKFGGLNDT